jgi:hypothetical protein
VINRIRAEFFFKDGLIMKHTDDFDIWKSKQALGIPGHLLGWTGYMQKKINENALHSQKSIKILLHDTSNFKDNFQKRFKSTKTRN